MANNKGKSTTNRPLLRFPAFTEEWTRCRVTDVLEFFTTNSLSWEQLEYSSSNLVNLHYGLIHVGLPTLIDLNHISLPSPKEEAVPKKFTMCCEGDVVFADTSEDTAEVGKAVEFINLSSKDAICGLHCIHGRDKIGVTAIGYKGYYFESPTFHNQIRNLAQGSKVFSISPRTFNECNFTYPSKAEQSKIAKFLSLIDRRIATQRKIIEEKKSRKSYIIKKFFEIDPATKAPRVRLAGFNNEWSLLRMNDFAERVSRKNTDLSTTLPLTISAQHGLVDQTTFFNKIVASENLSGYYLLKKGEFAYNKSTSGEYKWGAIKRLDYYDCGALSTLYFCFAVKDNIDSDFLVQYFESPMWYQPISEIAQEGARNHGLLNISVSDFFETQHWLTENKEEQKEIAHFLNLLDTQIEDDEKLLFQYRNQRRYLLSKMFI